MSDKERILRKELLTTKDASELIGVSLPSIINWADAGRFESFRTPGGHRRIRREDFVAFACENGYLLEQMLVSSPSKVEKVLLVDSNVEYMETLKVFLEVNSEVLVLTCSNIFEAGVLLGRHMPSILVFDHTSIPFPTGIVDFVLQNIHTKSFNIVALATDYPVPLKKQHDNYIYLNKGKSIREVALSLKNLIPKSS